MSDATTWAALALLVAAGWVLCKHVAAVRRERRWLPEELRRAKLAYAERLFKSQRPGLVARVDRAYRRDGLLVLVELKTRARHRVYAADVIELSAQKLAIEAQTGEEVDAQGYVLTARPAHDQRTAHR